MYCEDSAGTDIDHFRPKATYPQFSFTWTNYLLACSYCNSNAKRSEFPLTGANEPLLIDPTIDEPFDHLVLSLRSGKYVPLDAKGRETIRVFRLWRGILEKGRRHRWKRLQALIVEYDRLLTADRDAEAVELAEAIRDESFAAVLAAAVRAVQSPNASDVLGEECSCAIRERSEIRAWV
jgi:hypothetical protein